jgi:hypothetical protein
MPSSGLGSTDYTLRSVDGYSGSILIECHILDPPSPNIKVPTCTYGPLELIPLGPDQIVSGKVFFYPPGSAVPVVAEQRRSNSSGRGTVQLCGLALASVALIGLAHRGRALRWLALGALAILGLGGISACGGSGNTMTPGTYIYMIQGVDATNHVNATQIQLTVP